MAALYAPAGEDLEVGGDWYDTFALPDGRIAVVVGDVVGRGLVAASAMGQLRSAVRALAAARRGAGAAARRPRRVRRAGPTAQYATLVYAEVDPDTGAARSPRPATCRRCSCATATRRELFMAGPLGAAGRRGAGRGAVQAALELGLHDGFVLYTDGLVERRGESIDDGLDRLIAAVGTRPPRARRRSSSTSPASLLPADRGDDDVCLLCFARRAG